jgi:copper chaperone
MAKTVTHTFRVDGMHCGSCGLLIDDVVEDLDGVTRSQTTAKTGRAVVELDPQRCAPDDVLAAIQEAGYRARLEKS